MAPPSQRRSPRRIPIGAAWLGLLALALPAPVAAQAALDRAERELEEAQFERAAETLAEVADGDGPLDRDGVARLLRLRAVAGVALGRDAAVERDLLALAAVLGGREPGPMPRSLVARLDRARAEVRGPPRVRVRLDAEGDDVLRAVVELGADPGALTRGTELVCVAGDEELVRTEAADAALPARDDVVCRVRAIGPGGWVIDTAQARRAAALDPVGGETPDEPDWLLYGVLGGVGAAILLSLVIGIAVAASSERSVGGPMWSP